MGGVCAVGLVLRVSGWAVVSRWLVCAVGLCVALGRLCRAGACFFCLGDWLVRRVGIPAVGIAFAKNKIGPG